MRESGNRSSPGWWPIRNGAAATSSGSCSAAPPDGINHYKSAPFSVACGKYEPPCWKPLRSSGKQKSSMDDRPSQFRQQRIPPGVSDRQLSKPPGKIFGEAMHPLGIGVHSVLLLRCSCFPVSNGKRPADKLASHHRSIFTLERGGNEPLIAPLSHTLVLLRVRRTSRTTKSETTTERIANPTAVSSAL